MGQNVRKYGGLVWQPEFGHILADILGFGQYCQNPNPPTTQPNITKVVFDTKMTLHHHPHKLNVDNISTVTHNLDAK